MGKGLDIHLSKEDTQMAHGYMKRCSLALNIRKNANKKPHEILTHTC